MQRKFIHAARLAAAALALPLFAACSSQTQALPPGSAATSAFLPAAKTCKDVVYVSSYRLNYVAVYCAKGHNQVPLRKITDGISGPEGASVDKHGNFYVANTTENTVAEYARGGSKPIFTYSSGMSYPGSVAVDAQQNVYVTNLTPGSVEVFAQKSNTPKLTISSVPYPIDLALDRKGDVYVTTYTASFANGEIIEYPPGSTQGTNLGIATKGPGGIVLDSSGDIVTADQSLPGVLVFPPGKTSPSQTFAQNALDPDPVRFAPTEKTVYVGDSVGNAVYVYDYPSGKMIDTITDGIDGPNGVAADPAAPLY